MKRVLSLVAASALLASAANAATIIVEAPVEVDTIWTSDNEYVLRGFVFVKSGATLMIESGTVVRGEPGTGAAASALVVTREGKIFALGTKAEPIIFTALDDPMDGSWTPDQGGAWGGLVVLGSAPINSNDSGTGTAPGLENPVEGIPAAFGNDRVYGGEDADDSSGIIRYVSIRFGGSILGPDNEINGLTLGGVGRKTIIEFIEVFGNADDGVEFFGGNVSLRNAVVAFQGDDGFDYDLGWGGYGQFWFNISNAVINTANDSFEPDNGAEMDGQVNSQEGSIGGATIFNATYWGPGDGAGRALRTRDNAFSKYFNSLFGGWTDEAVRIDEDSAARINPDDPATAIELANSLFDENSFAGTSADDLSHGDEEVSEGDLGENDDEAYLFDAAFNNLVADPMLRGISRGDSNLVTGIVQGDGMLDPRPMPGSPALSGGAVVPDPDAGGAFFARTTFRGAFSADNNWMTGWTYLDLAGYLPEDPVTTTESKAANVSMRLDVAAGTSATAGFVITGEEARPVLIRAVGPALEDRGVPNFMSDPRFTVNRTIRGEIVELDMVDNWMDATHAEITEMVTVEVGGQAASLLDVDDTASASAIYSLAPGVYTVVVENVDDADGNVLIEVFDLGSL